ncbi:hypothetical protein BaRGS_00033877, partial [Batillaria attramentaria]
VGTWLMYSTVHQSAWLLMLMAAERAMSTSFHRLHFFCTRRFVYVLVAMVVAVSLVINAHLLYGFEVLGSENGTRKTCSPGKGYESFYMSTWPWLDLLFRFLAPFSVMVVSCVMILRQLKNAKRAKKTLEDVTWVKRSLSYATLALSISFEFMVLTLPVCLINAIAINWKEDPQSKAQLYLARTLGDMLVGVNSSLHPYLFFLSGLHFRKLLKHYARRQKKVVSATDEAMSSGPVQTGRTMVEETSVSRKGGLSLERCQTTDLSLHTIGEAWLE